ncbi:MAG TPA: trypsin-like peptidase domain-containing protein [Gemmatimonadaceae bacterium]|nr:trypsin-like peptidase domain-containing protein [Gemmatimonadaceae bacterium]
MPSGSPGTRGAAATTLRALSDDLAAAVERAGRSVVAIHARPRIPASGIYWRDGIVVAASHTIRKDQDIAVTLADGSRAQAQLVGRDGGTDLAVLRFDSNPSSKAIVVADRAPNDALRVGSLVLAVGRPGDEGVSTSLGVISTVGDKWRTWSGGEIDRFVRLDLAIYDGFSGGALVDADGSVLGMNCSALARGTPLAIPNATVERVVDALLTRGHVARAYLGVAMQPVRLTRSLAEKLGVGDAPQGVLVVMVESDSPADRSGLLVGDVIISVAGRTVAEPQDVAELLGGERVGSDLELDIVRGGERRTLSVTVGERAPTSEPRRRGRGS